MEEIFMISQLMTQLNNTVQWSNEVRKVSTGQGDDQRTDCLLDFAYFQKKYRLIAADLSKQNVLHAGSRAIQQIILIGKIKSTKVNKQKKQYYNFLKEQQKFCK